MSSTEAQRSTSSNGAPHTTGNGHTFGPGRVLRSAAKVLPEQARGYNRALLLQTLYHAGAMSRADVARETGLTRVTVSDLVAGLIADGIVVEKGVREDSRPGKPAILIDIDRDAHQIIGLDLSGPDAFVGAVVGLDGDILQRREIARPAGDVDGDEALAAVIGLARDLVSAATATVLGVGVGTPGVVDGDGMVLSAPNFSWSQLPLRDLLAQALDLPVLVANDANAAVLAEYTLGGAQADTMLVKVGRGVGSGLLTDGRPLLGSRFAAGELGHVTVGTDGGPECVCGKVGCLEAWLSVPALTARLANTPDEGRDGVLRDAGERLGIALAPILGVLDLSEIVLSGPTELLDGPLAEAAIETLRARTMARFHDSVRMRMTEHGQDIVLRGAAVMVLSGQLGVS